MKRLKLSRKNGWKAHVLCEILELKKHVLDTWTRAIKPKESGERYSTHEMLLLAIILHFYRTKIVDINELLSLNWLPVLTEFFERNPHNLKTISIHIDWDEHSVSILEDGEKYKNQNCRKNIVKLDFLVEGILDCLFMKGKE